MTNRIEGSGFKSEIKAKEGTEGEEVRPESVTEKSLDIVDETFTDLLAQVKYAPELKQEALKVAIQQFKQIAEQIRQVRDARQLHELKKLMLSQWEELVDLTKDNPEMLEAVQKWGKNFVEGKKLYYDFLNEIKTDLTDKAQEISLKWLSIQSEIGKLSGLMFSPAASLNASYNFGGNHWIKKDLVGAVTSSLSDTAAGYESEDIDTEATNELFKQLSAFIQQMTTTAYQKEKKFVGDSTNMVDIRPIDESPEIGAMLENLEKKVGELSGLVRESSKLFTLVKKVRDTHFLDLYNEGFN